MNERVKLSTISSLMKPSLIIGVLAFAVSTSLSAIGISKSLISVGIDDSVKWAVSYIVASIFALVGFVCWSQFGMLREENRLRQSIFKTDPPKLESLVAAGLVMAALSVLTSLTATAFIAFPNTVQKQVNQRSSSVVIDSLLALSDEYSVMAATMKLVNEGADERSEIETASGNTCGTSRPGYGPIARMRREHANVASTLQKKASSLSTQASELARKVYRVGSQQELDEVFGAAVALSRDPARFEIIQTADVMASGYGSGGFVIEGKRLFCPDPEMSARLLTLKAAASSVVTLPTLPPERRNATLFDTFGVVFAALLGSGNQADGLTQSAIIPLLVFSMFLDAVGAVGAVFYGRSKAIQITDKQRMHFKRVEWILENFVWSFPINPNEGLEDSGEHDGVIFRHQTYLFVPHGGDEKRTRDAQYMAALFKLQPDPYLQLQPMEKGRMRNEFHTLFERLILASGGADRFTAYPIPTDQIYQAIEDDKQRARIAIGLDYDNGSTFENNDGGQQSGNVFAMDKKRRRPKPLKKAPA